MNEEQKKIRLFHEKFGFTVNDIPRLIYPKLGEIRCDETEKELKELRDAIDCGSLVSIADALGDLLYFIYGTGVAYGIDLEQVFNEIHRSNMTKDRPSETGDHKAIKGPGYSPPDLAPIIVEQMKRWKI